MLSDHDHYDYESDPRVNWSTLREVLVSPLHYQHALARPRKDTPALAFGRAVHTAVLEPMEIGRRYVRAPQVDRRTKEGKAAWAACVEAASVDGREVIAADDYDRAEAIRDAVRAHPRARALLDECPRIEQPILWTDPVTGTLCKGRPDAIGRAIVDLKTARTIAPRRFGISAGDFGYHRQLAFYQWGEQVLTSIVRPCYILAVESDPPHDVGVIRIDDEALLAGWADCRRALDLLVRCRESGNWPGQYPDEGVLQLPPWELNDSDDDLMFGEE